MTLFSGWYFFRRINSLRRAKGLPPYRFSFAARRRAYVHCKNMIARGALYHADEYIPRVWTAYGQNVGEGPGVVGIADAFEKSPEHRANILDKDFKRVGVGVIKVKGVFWVTENFVAP